MILVRTGNIANAPKIKLFHIEVLRQSRLLKIMASTSKFEKSIQGNPSSLVAGVRNPHGEGPRMSTAI